MADISAIFFILLILGAAFPSMLAGLWLLFPNLVGRAQIWVEKSPTACFGLGLIIVPALVIPIILLFSLSFGPAKFLAWILLGASLAISSIGSAGIAALLGERLKQSGNNYSALNAFVRGAIILELASFFPLLGWLFVWIPLLLTSFGATLFALLHWAPRVKFQSTSGSTSPTHA